MGKRGEENTTHVELDKNQTDTEQRIYLKVQLRYSLFLRNDYMSINPKKKETKK